MPTKPTRALAQYFYFFMSLLIAAVVVCGFGPTIDQRFFHPNHRKPFLLSIHVGIFSAWVVLYIVQSALVRTGNVRIHRALGWFGVVLGVAIPIIGTITAVTMRRFDLLDPDLARRAPLLRTALLDITSFTIPFALAIYWRTQPELHRRLMLIASCTLTAAAFVRFPPRFMRGHGSTWALTSWFYLVSCAMSSSAAASIPFTSTCCQSSFSLSSP